MARARFPGASNTFADPILLDDVLRDFRRLDVVLADGGRGWWFDAAAFMALSNDRVWIELSGLPPSRLRDYYARHSWPRLTRRMIFATDWPGVPGIARTPAPWRRCARTRTPCAWYWPERVPRLQPEDPRRVGSPPRREPVARGDRHAAGPEGPPVVLTHRDCGEPVHLRLACNAGHTLDAPREVTALPGPGARRIA